MRAIWKGAVSFGLVNVPVRLFAATQEHDIRFHQVHREDGGRIRMKRTCSIDGEEVPYDQIAKGYESADGRLVDPHRRGLRRPAADDRPRDRGRRVRAGRAGRPDPLRKTLLPGAGGARRRSRTCCCARRWRHTDRLAVVKVAMRQRESLAVLRVRDRVIVLQTLLWPDEVRDAPSSTSSTRTSTCARRSSRWRSR